MSAPLVSVIMPFLNVESFIEEAVESVFAQSYRRWELLLVDDGSTDASVAIARRYAREHPDRVRYLAHVGRKNLGASAARNLGMRSARGSFLAFLDSDDVWLSEKLARQIAILDAQPRAGMVIGASHYWYSWTGRSEDAGRDLIETVGAPQDLLIEPPLLATLLYPLGRGAAPSLNSLLVRAAVAKEITWEERFRYCYTDQVFLTKFYLCTPIYVESACSDRYRQHRGSSTARAENAGDYHRVRLSFLEWLEAYLAAEGFEDPRVLAHLRAALWPYRHPARFFLTMLGRRPVGRMTRVAKDLHRRVLAAFG